MRKDGTLNILVHCLDIPIEITLTSSAATLLLMERLDNTKVKVPLTSYISSSPVLPA